MKINKNMLPSSKYSLKAPNKMTPTQIIVHNTANDASAKNEIQYMISNNNVTSFHYAIDDKEIWQGVPEDRNTWNAGDGHGDGNRKSIAIEICYSKSGGKRFEDAEKLAAKFIAFKLKEYGWGVDKVKKHNDYANTACPHRTLQLGWQRFLNMVQSELNAPQEPKECEGCIDTQKEVKHLTDTLKSLSDTHKRDISTLKGHKELLEVQNDDLMIKIGELKEDNLKLSTQVSDLQQVVSLVPKKIFKSPRNDRFIIRLNKNDTLHIKKQG